MTDRLGELGAIQYAQANPDTSVSGLGAAGGLQAAIADALSNGRANASASRLGGQGRIYALAAASGPLFLFQNSEVGVFYDPSDTTSMFQDSAGTTAAVVGQPVGLMLDKSQGLVLGPELVTNGNLTSWDVVGSATIDSLTQFTLGAAGIANRVYGITGGFGAGAIVHSITVTLSADKTGDIVFTDLWSEIKTLSLTTTPQTFTFYSADPVSAHVFYMGFYTAASQPITVTTHGISAKVVLGYHATQATSAARGILGTDLIDLDGVDDALLMAAGGGGSTGFFLCAAVRVDGGAGTARVIYSDAGTNTGYILRLNTSNQLELAAGNGTAYTLAATTDTLTAGPYVVTAYDDGTNLSVQVNSGTAGTAARPVVSAGTSTATIGKDNGSATGFFNGAIYPMVYVKNGENVSESDRTAAKAYVASKAGVTL